MSGRGGLSLTALVTRYCAFAALATLVNLGVQRVILLGGHAAPVFAAAIGVGTIAGLVTKYVLDKHWIFFDRARGAKAHGAKFGRYAFFGLFTTAIFWGSETVFWLAGRTDAWREAGAVLGLAVGYVVKYRLDRKFVFAPVPAGDSV
ncbi:GtrA family protein [Novosphingobium flavum]|uniref:GtrA family protein n=1 Tax=Novosphingobium flavum TaxID=1778672 RepID=UPI001FEBAF27|nr:GtrA family protein [Novosphingobium flavum]